ncbi:c-type cytochrome domain-containing protein [Luteolibacter soli]|uniref:C-type cytochrome domain-containing protein n=1 Tax=Luteolibacter soli TaxID=3135280 RepID=A0ABU9AT97_9BACT
MSLTSSRLLGLLAVLPLSLTLAQAQEPPKDGKKGKGEEWDVSKLDASKLPAAAKQEGVTYEKDIQPLLKESCFGCHGERKQKGDLRLDSLEAALKGGENGKVVVPGEAAKSSILFASAQVNDKIAMPPKRNGGGGPGGPGGSGGGNRPPRPDNNADKDKQPTPAPDGKGGPQGPGGPGGPGGPRAKPLTADQVALLRAWVEQGAK